MQPATAADRPRGSGFAFGIARRATLTARVTQQPPAAVLTSGVTYPAPPPGTAGGAAAWPQPQPLVARSDTLTSLPAVMSDDGFLADGTFFFSSPGASAMASFAGPASGSTPTTSPSQHPHHTDGGPPPSVDVAGNTITNTTTILHLPPLSPHPPAQQQQQQRFPQVVASASGGVVVATSSSHGGSASSNGPSVSGGGVLSPAPLAPPAAVLSPQHHQVSGGASMSGAGGPNSSFGGWPSLSPAPSELVLSPQVAAVQADVVGTLNGPRQEAVAMTTASSGSAGSAHHAHHPAHVSAPTAVGHKQQQQPLAPAPPPMSVAALAMPVGGEFSMDFFGFGGGGGTAAAALPVGDNNAAGPPSRGVVATAGSGALLRGGPPYVIDQPQPPHLFVSAASSSANHHLGHSDGAAPFRASGVGSGSGSLIGRGTTSGGQLAPGSGGSSGTHLHPYASPELRGLERNFRAFSTTSRNTGAGSPAHPSIYSDSDNAASVLYGGSASGGIRGSATSSAGGAIPSPSASASPVTNVGTIAGGSAPGLDPQQLQVPGGGTKVTDPLAATAKPPLGLGQQHHHENVSATPGVALSPSASPDRAWFMRSASLAASGLGASRAGSLFCGTSAATAGAPGGAGGAAASSVGDPDLIGFGRTPEQLAVASIVAERDAASAAGRYREAHQHQERLRALVEKQKRQLVEALRRSAMGVAVTIPGFVTDGSGGAMATATTSNGAALTRGGTLRGYGGGLVPMPPARTSSRGGGAASARGPHQQLQQRVPKRDGSRSQSPPRIAGGSRKGSGAYHLSLYDDLPAIGLQFGGIGGSTGGGGGGEFIGAHGESTHRGGDATDWTAVGGASRSDGGLLNATGVGSDGDETALLASTGGWNALPLENGFPLSPTSARGQAGVMASFLAFTTAWERRIEAADREAAAAMDALVARQNRDRADLLEIIRAEATTKHSRRESGAVRATRDAMLRHAGAHEYPEADRAQKEHLLALAGNVTTNERAVEDAVGKRIGAVDGKAAKERAALEAHAATHKQQLLTQRAREYETLMLKSYNGHQRLVQRQRAELSRRRVALEKALDGANSRRAFRITTTAPTDSVAAHHTHSPRKAASSVHGGQLMLMGSSASGAAAAAGGVNGPQRPSTASRVPQPPMASAAAVTGATARPARPSSAVVSGGAATGCGMDGPSPYEMPLWRRPASARYAPPSSSLIRPASSSVRHQAKRDGEAAAVASPNRLCAAPAAAVVAAVVSQLDLDP